MGVENGSLEREKLRGWQDRIGSFQCGEAWTAANHVVCELRNRLRLDSTSLVRFRSGEMRERGYVRQLTLQSCLWWTCYLSTCRLFGKHHSGAMCRKIIVGVHG